MLDENLPTFFLKAPPNSPKHIEAFYFTQHGTDPEAAYSLKHADPASPQARNTYAAALFDAYSPDILYGEVLAKPDWTQPSLSQEEIRSNGGVPPPPRPIFPTEFAIQLYNPDQQIIVRQHTAKWSGTVTFEFSMPQTTFRTPSSSTLDRSLDDPAADAATPTINFVWRKEGRIGKDMSCYLTGKSTDPTGKKAKRSKEPDITIAMFSGLKEMTIMEPNLYRVEIEDNKGLEVVLLLGAAVIRDLFFSNATETFHIGDGRKNSAGLGLRGRKGSSPMLVGTGPLVSPPPPPPLRQSPIQMQQPFPPAKAAAVQGLYNLPSRSLPPAQATSKPPPLDARAQWEIDAETARLKAQVDAEAKRQEEIQRKARRKAEEEEARKTRQFLEQEERQRKQEEKERRRRQAEVDKETERLRKQFGDQSQLHPPARPQQRHSIHSAPLLQHPSQQAQRPPVQPARYTQSGPYMQVPGGSGYKPAASHSSLLSNGLSRPDGPPKMKKKSFWGLRSVSEQSTNTLRKKQSSMF